MSKVLIISLVLNLFFISVSLVYINKRGGIKFLLSKFEPQKLEIHPNYFNQTNLFDTLSSKNQGGLVFLGDSITAGNQWSEFFPNELVKNRGISSDTAYRIVKRLDSVVDIKPKKLFIMAGINDLIEEKSVDDIISSFKEIINTTKTESPNTVIFIQSVLPLNKVKFNPTIVTKNQIEELNKKLEQLAKSNDVTYVNLYPLFLDTNNQLDEKYTFDGIHINGKGYLVWVNAIKKFVSE